MPNRSELDEQEDNLGRRVSHKGIMRLIRQRKREEAEERNRNSAPDSRRQFWRDRGFSRKSDAVKIIKQTVSDANKIANVIREKSGMHDWATLPEAL